MFNIKQTMGTGINCCIKYLSLSLLLAIAFLSCGKSTQAPAEITEGIAKYQYYEDLDMWNHIFDSTEGFVIPSVVPSAMIIPHHDITTGRQNSFYKAVSQEIQPSVIVIIAPNHFELGEKLITLPKETVFHAPDGDLEIDYDLISKIAEAESVKDSVSLQKDLWYGEHGIFIHSPFLKHYFPKAKVVPVLTKMLSTDEEFASFEKLGQLLAEILPEDALVIASVDFSHYQIPRMTEFHDSVAMNTIQNMEDPRYAEIDSPESIQVILKYCGAKQAVNPVLIDRSSTYDYIPDEFVESTSHQYWCFYKDSYSFVKQQEFYIKVAQTQQRINTRLDCKNQTILIGGSGSTGAGIRETWKWDRYNTSQDPAEILLKDVAGKEARFFYGFDAIILDPEAGTVYERKLHNTNLVVETISMKDYESRYKKWLVESLDKTFGDLLLPVLKIKNTYNKEVKVLEVVMSPGFTNINKETVRYALTEYDVVVFRDKEGTVDSKAYILDSDLKTKEYNLGILHGQGHIEGQLLALDFEGEKIKAATFEYVSENGVVPAIHQFIPDEE